MSRIPVPTSRTDEQLRDQPSAIRTRVLVADDHARILSAVAALLSKSFEVIASVSDGRTALEATVRLEPDLLILDISMPGMSGINVAGELKKRGTGLELFFSRSMKTPRFWRVVWLQEGWATW